MKELAKLVDYIEAENQMLESLDIKQFSKINIAILHSYTCENIEPILTTMLLDNKFNPNITFGDFNQYYQETMDSKGFLYKTNFDVIILLIRPEDVFAKIFDDYYSFIDNIDNEKVSIINKYKNMIENIQKYSSAKAIIITNMEEYEYEMEGIMDYKNKNNSYTFLKQINLELMNLINQYKYVHILDINKIAYKLGIKNLYDYKMKYISKDPYKIDVYIEMSKLLNRIIGAIYYRTKKLVAVDLDNTLYGGIIGEDGINGIKLSDEYPGHCYKKFQRTLKNLKNRGILLAIVSKNNYEDVKELFNNTHMILKEDDFVLIKANWEDKYINIRNIAKELNIGTDSIIFIDDNDYELQYVKKEMPEIEVIKVPKNSLELPKLLEEMNFFDKISITQEDKKKTELYKVKNSITSDNDNLDKFLQDLNMNVEFKILDTADNNIERVSEMTFKTNQFNMTTRRYTIADIYKFVQSNDKIVIVMNVKDKFGEHGNVGLSIVDTNNPEEWIIDSLLLSCRVLKRNLEFCMLNFVSNIARQKDINKLIGKYIPTTKNQAFSDFYIDAGFKKKDELFEFNLNQKLKNVPNYINITVKK